MLLIEKVQRQCLYETLVSVPTCGPPRRLGWYSGCGPLHRSMTSTRYQRVAGRKAETPRERRAAAAITLGKYSCCSSAGAGAAQLRRTPPTGSASCSIQLSWLHRETPPAADTCQGMAKGRGAGVSRPNLPPPRTKKSSDYPIIF